jgi:lactoylglutathione lyase
MYLTGVWHFSFHVADLERSLAFYSGLLGLKVVQRQEQSNAYTRALVGYPEASLRIAQLRVPGDDVSGRSGHHLELVEYVQPRMPALPAERARPGSAHLAFSVSDCDAVYAQLIAAGVCFVSPPNRITAGVNSGGACCYFLDPDDITLELVQPPPAHR